MVDKEIIVKLSVKPYKDPVVSGVYFLIHGTQVVYVGQTIDIFTRIKAHRSNPQLVFRKYFYIPYAEKEERESIEIKYIEQLCPKYNIRHNPKAIIDMEVAISLMTKEDRSHYPLFSVTKRIGWWLVEEIFERNNLKTKYKNVNVSHTERTTDTTETDL